MATLVAASTVHAEAWMDAVSELRHQWAHIKYQLPKAGREQAFARLYDRARQVRTAYPRRAESWIWEGVILADYAAEHRGLRALKMIRQSRHLFEQALAIDPGAMNGGAYTQLGTLYFEVPGWPIGFGDFDKARRLLEQGLSLSPDGLDANYFMGKFLLRRKRYRQARLYLNRAIHAPDVPAARWLMQAQG